MRMYPATQKALILLSDHWKPKSQNEMVHSQPDVGKYIYQVTSHHPRLLEE
jgi:hypothetical protein